MGFDTCIADLVRPRNALGIGIENDGLEIEDVITVEPINWIECFTQLRYFRRSVRSVKNFFRTNDEVRYRIGTKHSPQWEQGISLVVLNPIGYNFFVQTMTTEETSKLSLPEKFYKNSLRADNSKILHDQVAHRQGINKKKAAKWDFRATVEKKVQEISQILWLLRYYSINLIYYAY